MKIRLPAWNYIYIYIFDVVEHYSATKLITLYIKPFTKHYSKSNKFSP